jgi:predicted O-methyltransferase YrrM
LRLCAKYFSTPRARNDYATHVPILIGLARMREIRNVLEFGCGHYSTLTFLNRTAFPHLERLQSIENDVSWAETMKASVNDDRCILSLVTGEIADRVRELDLEAFDLILIDDSKTSAQRASTIRAIAARQTQRPWIVVHDFEVEEYRKAAIGFKQRHTFRAYNPHTGLVCNKTLDVKLIEQLVKKNSKALAPDDLEGWLTVFSKP